MMLILLITFVVILFALKKVADLNNVYPTVNCDDIKGLYGEKLQRYAILEW